MCALALVLASAGSAAAAGAIMGEQPASPRVFATSRHAIDEVLTRPYDRDVPMGCTGSRVWASSPQGWAFRDDVHWLDFTPLTAFDIEIRDQFGLLEPARATYFPSHIHYQGTVRREMTARASFTFTLDHVEHPLTRPFDPKKRWTCWSSGKRQDWYEVDFGMPRTLTGFDLFFFDDAPTGACRPPQAFEVQYFDGRSAAWSDLRPEKRFPARPRPGENRVRFEPVQSARFRFVFHHAGDAYYTGLYGVVPADANPGATVLPSCPLEIECEKFITASDCLVSIVRVHNSTGEVQSVYVDPVIDIDGALESWHVESHSGRIPAAGAAIAGHEPRSASLRFRQERLGYPVDSRFRYAVIDLPPAELKVSRGGPATGIRDGLFARPRLNDTTRQTYKAFGHPIEPGKTKIFKAVLEPRVLGERSTVDSLLVPANDRRVVIRPEDQDARDLLASQTKEYQAWFDANLPHFDCSDPWLLKMYYHRAYVLRKNMLDPKLGRLQWPTQSEGRWRSPWYANVISYGAGHQIREARWLRDPRYWQGHLRTWAENEKADGVYPSHVTTRGPAGGQYADWISSTSWDGELVHPDQEFLALVADKLAANVRGWQKQFDPDGDGLLLVDSHWWTGMEYQPSFFYFSDYKTTPDFYQPAQPVNIERVDLTAYNYGNAMAVARIYWRLGQPGKAREFDDLATRIARAVLASMWRPDKSYFYSLRASDDAIADVKEVIGVYPFYFGMVPPGKGYESAWNAIIDPNQFWTKWPVASASRECPAYSQTNWPGDGRAMACMWNGPTWPHANSLVMSAMARTLRATRDLPAASSALKPQHLWDLFSSFTRAQYRDQNIQSPWTGEFYNGDTGQWKTMERDYNHSTWLDILIPDLLGLVPREDDVLELDPLVPESALTHFLLDGVRYHGHDVTIAWDAPIAGSHDHYADGRTGFDLYLDGKLVASSPRLARLRINLNTLRSTPERGNAPPTRTR